MTLAMATLYVRNVPAPLYSRLRERASRSRRSINAEAIEVLQTGLAPAPSISPDEFLDRVRRERPRLGADAPTAAELIRTDRER